MHMRLDVEVEAVLTTLVAELEIQAVNAELAVGICDMAVLLAGLLAVTSRLAGLAAVRFMVEALLGAPTNTRRSMFSEVLASASEYSYSVGNSLATILSLEQNIVRDV